MGADVTAVKWQQARISFWVVYDHPTDYPEAFVARRWFWIIGSPPDDVRHTEEVLIFDTLGAVHSALDDLGYRLQPPEPQRDKNIIEVWL